MNPQLKVNKSNVNNNNLHFDNQINKKINKQSSKNNINTMLNGINIKFLKLKSINNNVLFQNENKIDKKKKILRNIFIDYSKNINLLNDSLILKEEKENQKLNDNFELNPSKDDNKILGIKKKRTNDVSSNFLNNKIKILKEDEETFPASSELIINQSNFHVKFFFKFLQSLKKIVEKLKKFNFSFTTEVEKASKKYLFEINKIKYSFLIDKLKNNKIIELIIDYCYIYKNDKEISIKLEEIYNSLECK